MVSLNPWKTSENSNLVAHRSFDTTGSHPSLLHLHQILHDRRENLLHLAELRLKQNELELARVRDSDKKAVMSWWQVSRVACRTLKIRLPDDGSTGCQGYSYQGRIQ
jgi:hypothetical protein